MSFKNLRKNLAKINSSRNRTFGLLNQGKIQTEDQAYKYQISLQKLKILLKKVLKIMEIVLRLFNYTLIGPY